jgi:hypothetical protein
MTIMATIEMKWIKKKEKKLGSIILKIITV